MAGATTRPDPEKASEPKKGDPNTVPANEAAGKKPSNAVRDGMKGSGGNTVKNGHGRW